MFLRGYFHEMDVPEDEDGLIRHITVRFEGEKEGYENLLTRYTGHKYPDKPVVSSAVDAMKEVLSYSKDNTALIDCVIKKKDEIYDLKEKVQNVESFFSNQKALFDEAVEYEEALQHDLEYIAKDEEAEKALNTIRLITLIPDGGGFNYGRLPELNDLLAKVHAKHDAMLEEKRQELLKIVDECLEEIRMKAKGEAKARGILQQEEDYFAHKKEHIAGIRVLTLMDGQMPNIWLRKDEAISRIENLCKEDDKREEEQKPSVTASKKPKKIIKSVYRQSMFPKRTIETDADIDEYVEHIRRRMKTMLKDCDGIRLD
jgi:putative ATPase